MKPKTIVPLVLGVCVGGIAIKLVVDVVNNAQGATRANLAQCVVAKMDIGLAEEISPEHLMLKDWPKDSLPAEYFASIEEVQQRVTSMFIPQDVPVYPSMLAPPGTPPGIQTRIKPGFRAVSVAIDEITGVAFQLRPGDRVDLISMVQRQVKGGPVENVSRIILQNIEIVAVGRTLHNGKAGQAKKTIARSVTVLLRPEEVTKLHLAQSSRGKISLALRGSADSEQKDGLAGASKDDLLGREAPDLTESEPDPPPLEPVKIAQAPSASWVVRVISGNNMRMIKYDKFGDQWLRADEHGDGHDGSVLLPEFGGENQDASSQNDAELDPGYGREG